MAHENAQKFIAWAKPITTWEGCKVCGATTRHDGGVCIRNPRNPHYDVRLAPALLGSTERLAQLHEREDA